MDLPALLTTINEIIARHGLTESVTASIRRGRVFDRLMIEDHRAPVTFCRFSIVVTPSRTKAGQDWLASIVHHGQVTPLALDLLTAIDAHMPADRVR